MERYLRDAFSGGEASAPLLEIKRNGKVELGCPNLESTECAYSEAYKILTVAITRERGVEEAEALETWGFPVSRNILRGLRLAAGSIFSMWRWLEGSLCSLGQVQSRPEWWRFHPCLCSTLCTTATPPISTTSLKRTFTPEVAMR